MRLTMFTGPYPVGEMLGGIGLRLWELANTLADEGIEVIMACPPGSDPSWSRPGVQVRLFDETGWPHLVAQTDGVLTTDLPDARVLLHAYQLGKVLISENSPPIEHLDYHRILVSTDPQGLYDDLVARYLLQAWTSDHFVVRSSVERAGMLGTLVGIGRLSPAQHARSRALSHLLTLLPIGFTTRAAEIADAAPPTCTPTEFVWNGGIWNYYDTNVLLRALRDMRAAGRPGRIRFLYGPPVDQHIAEADRLLEQVNRPDLRDIVIYPDEPLPHTARDGVVKSSRVLVCLGRDGAENHTCHRLRLRDALLYRLPVVIDAHGASGDWVRQLGIGLAVDTGDPQEVTDAMNRLAFDQTAYDRCRAAIERVRPAHTYEANVSSLLAFLGAGNRALDAASPRQKTAVAGLLRRRPTLTATPLNPI
ncbi:glycosyltransferase family 4 protein [Nonomuraea lactucae]|uniref:glycosyltransferase family 4 protein n=1 Tax=Nonomuraea lactucae TaxID=2249762 RepID=UPI0013B36D0F|nr:glycosyltransferase family 4 protein [Nonomuraea lactucae]